MKTKGDKKSRGRSGSVKTALLLSLLIFSGLAIISIGTAAAAPSVSVSPASTTDLSPDDTFSIDVLVDSVDYNLRACTLDLTYNSTAFTVDSVTYKDLLGASTDVLESPDTGRTDGRIRHGIARKTAVNPSEPESGTFITVNFTVNTETAEGTYALQLSNVSLKDENNDVIPGVEVTDGNAIVGAEIHDINVTTDYLGAVGGIKITRDGTDVVGADENLTIGETYTIRYKLVNEGDFYESIAVTVKIDNETLETHTYSLTAGDSNTYSDEWDTTELTAGVYTITVSASIADDANPADNERTRDVMLETAPEQVPVSDAEGGYEPDIALSSAGNIYVAFRGYASEYGGIDFAKSTDGGDTFSPQIPVGAGVDGEYAGVAAYDDNVYIVWSEDLYSIYYARSTNGGDSFKDKVQVNDADGTLIIPHENLGIAVNSSGVIYVIWPGDNHNIHIDKSMDGTTFGTDAVVANTTTWDSNPSIAIDRDDNILVAWDGDDHVYFAKSTTDGGAAFSTPVQVDDSEVAEYPSIVVDPADSSKIYVAWQDKRNVYADIYAATSDNGGESFGDDVKVNDVDTDTNSHQKYPCMAVNSSGAVFVVWQDGRNYETFGSDYDAYFAGSTDAGSTFSANRKVNPNETKAEAPTLTVDNTNAFVAWENTDDGKIYFRKGSLSEWTPEEEQPDLIVTEIEPKCGELFANESNNITATVKNNGSTDADAFNVSFAADGFSDKVSVSGLAAGATATVYAIDNLIRNAGDTVTITVTADCDGAISESNDTNNARTLNMTVVNNGYKGKRYTGGANMTTWKTFELNGNLTYSLGDSYYLSAYTYSNWTTYIVNWTASDLSVPGTATIREARLYVPYTWDKADVMPDEVSLTFNDETQTLDKHYSDRKGHGYYNYPYGMLAYNVTADFDASSNTAVLTNSHPGGNNVSMRGMVLVVVYADESEPTRTIYMNEEFDMLYGGSGKCTTPAEATAYAPFSGMTIEDMNNVTSAKLITVAPGAGPNEGELIFNDHTWNGVWNFTTDAQIGIDEHDVTTYLQATDNEAGFQSSADYMEASNAILVVTAPIMKGDINGDGEVDLNDAIYLAKHVLGWEGYEEIYANDDINGNGEVDLNDAIYLAKHVLGWEGYEDIDC